jgi:hypothetical protein
MNAPPKITTLTSREFNQDTARAKRAAEDGPVFITTRGELSHVLMTIEEYRRREPETKPKRPFRSLAEALAHPESAHIDFDPPRVREFTLRPVDFN